MRTGFKRNIYLSDFFSYPIPAHAASGEAFLRKLRNRRILWTVLPGLLETAALLTLVLAVTFGLSVCAIGFGGV